MAIDPHNSEPRPWQIVATENLERSRRRLTFRLGNGVQRSLVIAQADDSNEMRTRIGDAFEAESHRFALPSEAVEG